MHKFRLGPAGKTEPIVYGAQGPAYSHLRINEWIAYMKENGIRRICCLLHSDQLKSYKEDLFETYGREFGVQTMSAGHRSLIIICVMSAYSKNGFFRFSRNQMRKVSRWSCIAKADAGEPGMSSPRGWCSVAVSLSKTRSPASRKWDAIRTKRQIGAMRSLRTLHTTHGLFGRTGGVENVRRAACNGVAFCRRNLECKNAYIASAAKQSQHYSFSFLTLLRRL